MKKLISFICVIIIVVSVIAVAPIGANAKTESETDSLSNTCPHTYRMETPGFRASCTSDGVTASVMCIGCGEYIVEPIVIPALGHEYEVTYKAPTCTETGFREEKCKNCGSASGAYYGKLEHTYAWITGKPATLLEEGLTDGVSCSVCQHVLVPQEVIPPTGVLGDVDGDKEVRIIDATEIQRHIAQLTTIDEEILECADTDIDGKITILDATQIQRFLAQIIESL